MLGSMPTTVFTKSTNKLTKNTNFKKFSFASYIFTYPNNVIVSLKVDGVCIHPHFHEFKIFQKNHTFISNLNGQFEINKDLKSNYNVTKRNYEYPDKRNRKKLIQKFINTILDKTEPVISKKKYF